jgi:chemotaxis protein MotB
LITLLLAFFVIMYALSAVDIGKYQVVSDSLQANLRSSPQSPTPLQIGEIGYLARSLSASLNPLMGEPTTTLSNDPVREASVLRSMQAAEVNINQQAAAVLELEQALQKAIGDLGDEFAPTLQNEGLWLELEVNNRGLFDTASADLRPAAQRFFANLATELAPLPVMVRVEGHTDDQSIETARYPSNWELSGARAASVVRLMADSGLPAERLVAMGFADSKPVAENTGADNRQRNRRVVLVLVRPPEYRAESVEFAFEDER